MTGGETPQETLENVCDAIACWVEACKEMGWPVGAEAGGGRRRTRGRGSAKPVLGTAPPVPPLHIPSTDDKEGRLAGMEARL